MGLHWLMVSPKPLHVTTSDEALRKRSWEYLSEILLILCADLGPGGVMVFGSPKQRATHSRSQPRRGNEALDRRAWPPWRRMLKSVE